MKKETLPVKVRFTHEHYQRTRGAINRHHRRKFLKLSRIGKLTSDMVPYAFLVWSDQLPQY